MKKFLFLCIPALLIVIVTSAQIAETVTVKAGTALLDYFSKKEIYLNPEFQTGKIFLKTNVFSEKKLNYNYLNGEIEFLDKSDTLLIINKEDLKSIVIAQDTFYHDHGYIRQIRNEYPKIGLKEFFEFKEIQRKDPYGVMSSGSSSISYQSLSTDGNFYKLTLNQDIIFERKKLYYISSSDSEFVYFLKKNVFKLFPKHKGEIKEFLKTNKIKFESEEELLKLAEYLGTL
jgi:hypothetical protein